MRIRIGLLSVICLALLLCLAGCESSRTESELVPEVYYDMLSGDDVAEVSLTTQYATAEIDRGIYNAPGYYDGIKDMHLKVANKSGEAFRICWEKSKIYYGGRETKVNYIGQGKYGRDYVIPDTLIRAGAKHEFTIFPQDQLKLMVPGGSAEDDFNVTYKVNVMPATEVDVLLCIVHGEKESLYTVHIEPKGVWIYET